MISLCGSTSSRTDHRHDPDNIRPTLLTGCFGAVCPLTNLYIPLGQYRWVLMSYSPTSGHADFQPRFLKRKRRHSNSDDEFDNESISDDDADSVVLGVARHIKNEVDLEVAIRERLVSTIEGRIQWALQLLTALSSIDDPQTQPCDADEFQDAALDAFEALDAPSAFIFDTALPEEPSPSPRSFSPLISNQQPLQRVPKTRPSRTPKPPQQKKLLYIKLPSGTSDNQLAILACPICRRTQFTTLQGLLNHARLSHGIEWASHDACMAACAVPVSADDQNWEAYAQDGVEVPLCGSVVGLRRLFERAVGVDGNLPTSPSGHAGAEAPSQSSTPVPSTLLSRTLGLHADSPALAKFLGRAPKRRCIHVHDEDQDVDILKADSEASRQGEIVSGEGEQRKKAFHMHYPHRSTAREGLDLVVDGSVAAGTEVVNAISNAVVLPAGSAPSRFHITARIRLEDRSLYLSDARREGSTDPHQYRWMLAVTAPSYSLPLASFLTRVTVVPPKPVSPVSLSVQQQPFAVIGTANEPFLAKIIFGWVDGSKMEVEHWVDLDQSRSSVSVTGSEQVLDVELDRNAPFLPAPKGNPPPLPSLDRDFPVGSSQRISAQPDLSGNRSLTTVIEERYEQVLRGLLPRVPMTAKDVKPRTSVHLPYKLVASPAHLLALVPGRRKAIEWGRARALHALYVEQTSALPLSQQTPLSVGDVYMFLEDASLFPRSSLPPTAPAELKKKEKEKEGTPIPGDETCMICGIKRRLHPGYHVKSEEAVIPWTCAVVSSSEQCRGGRLPLINLLRVLTCHDGLERTIHGPRLLPQPKTGSSSVPSIRHPMTIFPSTVRYTPRDLVTFSPPDLILAVQNSLNRLGLPRFPNFASCGMNPAFLASREQTERSLAPAALLSATLKPFISMLLRSAIEVAKRDVTAVSSTSATAPGGKAGHGKRAKKIAFVLTPGHVLRGLELGGSKVSSATAQSVGTGGASAKEVAALCLARVGVSLDFGRGILTSDHEPNVADHEQLVGEVVIVKAEPE
ncbi:hypothetical protein PAXRUDRAFT_133494 [Paxillus rubicundulus Ve08.2h10]|uniref:YEATS domain-containing protein n=1 Tax=Paxillus rubicundulus Ve08.2h10 TaxID=930991 RepID=A0A0D0E8S6_9AGAM|nr:hypothetical protein PAXRUDRAFT_133494 [Paxillus rubicundulus Ve08.2h10]